jgi:hypothetical protein
MIVWKGEEGSAVEWDEDVDESEGESKTGWRIEDLRCAEDLLVTRVHPSSSSANPFLTSYHPASTQ